jgi:hypothetical protein
MRNIWEIKNHSGEYVGSLEFGDFDLLRGHRTATGFLLRLPVRVRLQLSKQGEPLPLLSNLEGTICTGANVNDSIELGEIRALWFHSGAHGEGEFDRDYQFTWIGPLEELVAYEKIRAGGQPRFRFILRGELCYLVQSERPRYDYRTHPQGLHGDIEVNYDKEKWVRILRELNVSQNVLVEVPLPKTPSTEWDEVWQALIDARNYFDQGGGTGWKGCVASIRLALEKWQALEPEDQGLPNWKPPSLQEKKTRSKRQRLDALRWHLLQLAHLGAHTDTRGWTREDATLLLSTLSCLLAEKHS